MKTMQTTTKSVELPLARVSEHVVAEDAALVASQLTMLPLLDAVPMGVLILNETRQIVFCNTAVIHLAGGGPRERIYGMRPGEALDCRESKCDGGCGTNEACVLCGAAQSIESVEGGNPKGKDWRMTPATQGLARDLRISVSPMVINARQFTVMCLTDVSDEKRRRALERVFFHDVRNVLGALLGYLQLSAEGLADPEHSARVLSMAQCLADEISSFEELLRAESGELQVQLQPLSLAQVCRETAELVQQHGVATRRQIVIAAPADVTLSSDVRMLRRILVNLLKNALEASPPGARVTLDWGTRDDEAFIRVHNDGFIPREVQLQIFQRSFSTKGPGRGLGTYSVRLFAESFLNGRVAVDSCPEGGTTFTVCLPRR